MYRPPARLIIERPPPAIHIYVAFIEEKIVTQCHSFSAKCVIQSRRYRTEEIVLRNVGNIYFVAMISVAWVHNLLNNADYARHLGSASGNPKSTTI